MIRFISAFIPSHTYEQIKASAAENKITIEEEISWVLCEVYDEQSANSQRDLKAV
jgi:hypothetical protein